ncbi:MAG: response regulator [Planctomycetota bacterium]|nr:MAG: response regulator [Planctomycetota bacterium]
MNDTISRSTREARRVSRLVWLLAGVGGLAGAVILGLVHTLSGEMDQERIRLGELELNYTWNSNQIHQDLNRSHQRIEHLLAGKSDPEPVDWEATLSGLVIYHQGREEKICECPVLHTFLSLGRQLSKVEERAETWQRTFAALDGSFQQREEDFDRSLKQVMVAVEKAQGGQRLQLGRELLALRRMPAEEAALQALKMLRNQGGSADFSQIRAELLEISQLTRDLLATKDPDRLVDIKDNHFQQSLVRLQHQVDQARRMDPQAIPEDVLKPLQMALFGHVEATDRKLPEAPEEKVGLYHLQGKRLELIRENVALDAEINQTFLDFHRAKMEVEEHHRLQAAGHQRRVDRLVKQARIGTGLVGIIALGCFLLLANRVSKSLRKQIEHLRNANEAMNEARLEAQSSSKAKSEFLANMSHEIRTPLNGVIGMTSLLSDTKLNLDQKEFVRTIQNSGETLLSLINDILDFSKIEAGKMELDEVDFQPASLVEESMELVAAAAHDKGVELIMDLPSELPMFLFGDPVRIRQILINLLSNAVKFTHEGEIVVRVRFFSTSDQRIGLRMEVQDTGIGIPAAAQKRLFHAFTQADGSTTRQYGGTGLGLTICKRLAEMMDGDIGFRSKEGKGSRFFFTVRVKPARRAKAIALPTQKGLLDGMRVLCVDDNETNRKILLRQTKKWRMDASLAEGGQQALKALHEANDHGKPFEIVLLDMNMPGMDGLELANRIRQDPNIQEPLLLLLTSMDTVTHAMAEEHGIATLLRKPIRPSLLLDSLVELTHGVHLENLIEVLPSSETGSSSKENALHGLKVLLVEDNAVNQKVALRMLSRLGCQSELAEDGRRAVEKIASGSFDVVLMDCQMPIMDGYEATRLIRRAETSGPVLPIIAMTANAMKGDREKCLTAGMSDYLVKPVVLEALERLLLKYAPSTPSASKRIGVDGDSGSR